MTFRPGRSDTEEDILKEQNQFLSGRLRPAAAAVRVRKEGARDVKEAAIYKKEKTRDVVQLEGFPSQLPSVSLGSPSPPKKKSKFKERRAQKKKTERQLDEDADAAELLDRHDRHFSTLLSQIKERDTHSLPVMMPIVSERGFPNVLHRGDDIKEMSCNKNQAIKTGQSLFAQQFAKAGGSIFGIPQYKPERVNIHSDNSEKMELETNASTSNGQLSGSNSAVGLLPSSLITGQGLKMSHTGNVSESEEVKKIHEENVERLSTMSEKEILEEQAKLRASLDPALLAFLQTRKKEVHLRESKGQSDKEMKDHCMHDSQPSLWKPTKTDNRKDTRCVQFAEDVSMKEYEKEDEDFVQKMEDGTLQIGDVKLAKNVLHMDKLEGEKLEWMRNCPTPSAVERKGGNQARFGFDGNLVSRASAVPVHLGLHHHGDDPEAAGYTLEELFVLSRSNFLQQRVLALQVLAKVINQEHLGQFEDNLEACLLPVLLEAGLIFLLRWALDDSSDAVIAVAVQGLAAVLVVPSDKELAERCCVCYRGLELPSLQPPSVEKTNKKAGDKRRHENDDEEGGTSDTEVLKRDIVKGLLQMRLLPRLRYILEVCRPSPPVVLSVLEILTRVAQHSTEASSEIVRCPRLLDTIFCQFLPVNWKSVPDGGVTVDVYGTPLREALLLMRRICCAGKHMAATLVTKYDLTGRILRYTALHPRDQELELSVAYELCVESFRTWTVCLSYGLTCDAFREMYTTFVQHLQSIQCISSVDPESNLEISRYSAILGVIDTALHVAGTTAELHAKMSANAPGKKEHDAVEADTLPRPPLDWSHMTGFSPLIGGCIMKWGQKILTRDPKNLRECDLSLLSSIFNLLASFYSKLPVQPSFSPVEDLEDVEDLVTNILLPLTTSEVLNQLLQELRDSSLCCGKSRLQRTGTIPSLPGYGCRNFQTFPDEKCKSVIGSVAFVTSFLRLMTEVAHVHKGMASKFVSLVTNKMVLDYAKGITQSEVEPNCFFVRTELHLQYFLVKLFYHVVQGCNEDDLSDVALVYHQVALVLFTQLQPGDEYYAHDLMSTVLFNSRFYPETKDHLATGVTSNLSELSIQSEARPTAPQPTTGDPVARDRGVLLCEAHKNLSAVRSTFISSFSHMKHALAVSRSLARHQPHEIASLLLPSGFAEPLLPADWMFSPIVELHNQVVSAETAGGNVHIGTGMAISIVTTTLQLALLLEEWRPVTLRHVTMVARVARLMCVFLAGSDLFLNNTIHSYLAALLHVLTRPSSCPTRPSSCLDRLDFGAPVPGLTSFYDLYASLLSHYAAVSFGDSLFACFLVLPLAQRYHSKFRTALWDEHVEALRALSLRPEQLPVSLEHYLYPVEQDEHLLSLYLRALATQSVREQWSPLFFLLAIHHLNSFIFQRVDPEDTASISGKLTLLNRIMLVKDEDIRHKIIYYYRPDVDSQSFYELFSSLPADRQLLLRNRSDPEGCREMYSVMQTS